MEDNARKIMLLRVGIALCVAALFFAVAYIALKKRSAEPSQIAHPQFEIPVAELQNIAATEERMRTLQSAQSAKVEEEKAGFQKAGETAAKQIRNIEEETAKRTPVAVPLDNLPGGAFDFNPR